LSSEKLPSSNTSKNSQPSGSSPWIECGISVLVDGGDPGAAVQHVGPFGRLVPVQLAHAAGVQAHVDAGNVLGDSELALRHLAGPAAAFQSHVGLGKRKLQVRHRAVIGGRRHIDVRVLQLERNVARPGIGAAASRTHRLRRTGRRIGRLRIGGGHGGDSYGGSAQHSAAREAHDAFLPL
jgi:hypothetical protein